MRYIFLGKLSRITMTRLMIGNAVRTAEVRTLEASN